MFSTVRDFPSDILFVRIKWCSEIKGTSCLIIDLKRKFNISFCFCFFLKGKVFFQPSRAHGNTFWEDSFWEMLRHPALFLWRWEATATTEINPMWARMSVMHTDAKRAAGSAVQPKRNESVAGWYDWQPRPGGPGMTRQWPQQVPLLQNM